MAARVRAVVLIPRDLKETTERLAAEDGRSMSNWVERLIVREIESRRDEATKKRRVTE